MRRRDPTGTALVAAAWALVIATLMLSVGSRLEAERGLYRRARAGLDGPVESHFSGLGTPATWTQPGPPRVGVQAGHWRIEELPEELRRLRSSTGARFGEYREVDANLGIARRVVEQLRTAGMDAELLPATVPPGYRADAFVSIHADGAARLGARGWKAATPWRASDASRQLLDALAFTYSRFTDLPEDRYGTTYNMRGYYAFSHHRCRHAIHPSTPAVIIETGFVTVRSDRDVLFGNPESVALGISSGIMRFLARRDRFAPEVLAVRAYPAARVITPGAPLSCHPEEGERLAGRLPAGTMVRPVHRKDGWVEVIVWGNYRRFGWVRESDLEPVGGPS
ncbi:MAG: N-acetylmuramoyl-L-alanine amidase [Spirochaetales bacterium]|nr:N-acetylmuramoyl-L-alanine amidase [Spirochaetales bacterium]